MSKDKQTGAFDRYDGEMAPRPDSASPVSTETGAARSQPAEPVVGAVKGSGADAGGSGADSEEYDVDPVGGGGRVAHPR